MEVKKFIRKQNVYKQKDEADGIYFIRSGEFQVIFEIIKECFHI
jgi:CRP-like cAMP-binding protein